MNANKLILLFLFAFSGHKLLASSKKTVCEKHPNKNRYGHQLVENSKCAMNLSGWECLDGYVQRRDNCVKLDIPKNAFMNEDSHTWSCKRGFQKYRNVCKKIKLPKNAILTKDGNDWICSKGFSRYKHRCKRVK